MNASAVWLPSMNCGKLYATGTVIETDSMKGILGLQMTL